MDGKAMIFSRSPRQSSWYGSISWLAVAAFCWAGCSSHSESPRLALSTATLDLGDGLPWEMVKGTVALRNDGSGALRIHDVQAGCACSSLELSSNTILPGQEANLTVTAHLKEEKTLVFRVRILSNDSDQPEAVVIVRARIAPPFIAAESEAINFGEFCEGSAPIQKLTVLKPDGNPWPRGEPITVESVKGQVIANAMEGIRPGLMEPTVLSVGLRPGIPLGSFTDTLLIRPKGSSRALSVLVQGNVVRRLSVAPQIVLFGDVPRQGKAVIRHLVLRRTDGQALGKLSRWTAPPGVRVEQPRGTASSPSKAVTRLAIVLEPSQVNQDLPNGKVALWLENEKDPLTVGVMITLSKKGTP